MKKKSGSEFLAGEIREIAESEPDKDGRLNVRTILFKRLGQGPRLTC